MKIFYTLLLLTLSISFLSATTPKEGYVITKNARIIPGKIGEVSYSPWDSRVVFFNNMGTRYAYHPATIFGFVFQENGKEVLYESKYHHGLWLFLRVEERGRGLCLYRNMGKKQELIRQIDGVKMMDVHINEFWLESSNGDLEQVLRLNYKKLLRQKCSKYPDLVAKIGKPGYKFKNLPAIIKEYNILYGEENEKRI